ILLNGWKSSADTVLPFIAQVPYLRQSTSSLANHSSTFGSELTDNLRQDQGYYAAVSKVFTANPASSLISALYVQDEFVITHKISLSSGLRYDHYTYFGGTTNPRLGLIYHPFQPTTFKLLYGSAFRAPEVYERWVSASLRWPRHAV